MGQAKKWPIFPLLLNPELNAFKNSIKCYILDIAFSNQVRPSTQSVVVNEDGGNVDTDTRAMTRIACESTSMAKQSKAARASRTHP